MPQCMSIDEVGLTLVQSVEICPLVEYLIQKMSNYYYFEKYQPRPIDAMLELPDRPGFGIELDESKIADIRPVTWRL